MTPLGGKSRRKGVVYIAPSLGPDVNRLARILERADLLHCLGHALGLARETEADPVGLRDENAGSSIFISGLAYPLAVGCLGRYYFLLRKVRR